MILLTIVVFGLGALVFHRAIAPPRLRQSSQLALYVLCLYVLILVSTFPLFWFDRWSLPLHALTAGLLSLAFLPAAWRKGFSVPKWKRPRLLHLAILFLGIGLQWRPIYHLYATHDPTAYLSGALNLTRTGHFSHTHPLVGVARKNPLVAPLLNWDTSPEPWRLFRNYGVVPSDSEKGIGRFHGLPGATVFLALGQALFGEEHLLRIHWIHFIAAFVLIAALLDRWIPKPSLWKTLGLLLYAVSPLIALIFREPLSEPLASVFFLGMILALSHYQRPHLGMPYLFMLCVAVSVIVRVSGLMYVPFFVVAAWVLLRDPATRDGRWTFAGLSTLTLGIAVVLVFHLSPNYVAEILTFYSSILLRRVPTWFPWMAASFGLIVSGIVIHRASQLTAFPRGLWRVLWMMYAAGLGAALLFRYGKLIIRLAHNIGGFPFVLFNLDSLLFYGCPLVVVLGLLYWFHRLYKMPFGRYAFFQMYVPFCVFFYGAFRFLPLNVQVNFQRYLIIELLPLSILGATLAAYFLSKRHGLRFWAPAGATIAIAWTAGITYFINRGDISQHAYAYYHDLRTTIGQIEAEGKRPILVGVRASWKESAFLHPLVTAFGYPVAFAPHGFSFQEKRALQALREEGFEPILVIEAEKLHSETELTVNGERWTAWKAIDHCYNYAAFGLGAPPIELARTCNDFKLFRPSKTTVELGHAPKLSWGLRHASPPMPLGSWIGVEWKGCSPDDEIYATLRFYPEEHYTAPLATLDGEPTGIWKVTSLSKDRKRAAHIAELSVPAPSQCASLHQLDIFFPPISSDELPRRGELLEFGIRKRSHSSIVASR